MLLRERLTPLTSEEQREIVRTYMALRTAIDGKATDSELEEPFSRFQRAYRANSRGNCRATVDAFVKASDKKYWAGQLRLYLIDEIEDPRLWSKD